MTTRTIKRVWCGAIGAVLVTLPALHAADFRLGSPFADHMVLQCEKPVAFWGWADAGEAVTVAFAEQTKTAVAGADGKWALTLDALQVSTESRTLSVTGKDGRKVEVKDVLVGEVWFGSGQSNMAMGVASANNFDVEKAAASFPLVRYYVDSSEPAEKPQAEGKGSWQECTPANVGRYSATLYFFGREIHREVGVPVGLMTASAGATHIESWISAEAQCSDPDTKAEYDSQLKSWINFTSGGEAKMRVEHEKKLADWKLAVEQGKAEKKDRPNDRLIAHIKGKGSPAGLYNGRVFNLAPFTLRGILWYQGESNTGLPRPGQPHLYRKQLSQLVTSWRALWGDELPFAWVQLPNFTAPHEGWPRVREAMLQALELPKTGMAITIDIGDPKNIHPTNKQEVGRRLSLWALGTVYGKNVAATSGPLPAGSSVGGSAITVSFKHANGGLKTQDGGPVKGFQIAGADRQWRPATAKIDGDTVVISSPDVASPVAVRYAWLDNPDCNLCSEADLPASPLRTDDWPIVAVEKK